MNSLTPAHNSSSSTSSMIETSSIPQKKISSISAHITSETPNVNNNSHDSMISSTTTKPNPQQNPSNDVVVVDIWPDCNPDLVLKQMHLLDVGSIGMNKKPLFASYKDWSKLNAEQRNKALAFFVKLSQEMQSKVLIEAKALSTSESSAKKNRS